MPDPNSSFLDQALTAILAKAHQAYWDIQNSQKISYAQAIPVIGLVIKYVQDRVFCQSLEDTQDIAQQIQQRDVKKEANCAIARAVGCLILSYIFSSQFFFFSALFEVYVISQQMLRHREIKIILEKITPPDYETVPGESIPTGTAPTES